MNYIADSHIIIIVVSACVIVIYNLCSVFGRSIQIYVIITYSNEDDSNGLTNDINDSSIKTGLEPHNEPNNNTYELETDLKSAEDFPSQSTSIQGGTEVVDKDDNGEDTVIMDVFLVDEGEAVIVKRSLKLKQRVKQSTQHLSSGCQVFLSLIKYNILILSVYLHQSYIHLSLS